MFKPYIFLLFLSVLAINAFSSPQTINGQWLNAQKLPIESPNKTGGDYYFTGTFSVQESGTYVIDFARGSLYEFFSWKVIDSAGEVVSLATGGVGNPEPNEVHLRHGKSIDLIQGDYYFELALSSIHLIIAPMPYIETAAGYYESIQTGNMLTVFGLGIFFSLMFYYFSMYLFRHNKADLYYALFILGNFLLQGTSLMFFKDVFGLNIFLLAATPILFSSIFYILFVSELLSLKVHAPKLYLVSKIIVSAMAVLAVFALIKPQYMMEVDRIEVGVFSLFGLLCGIVLALRKNKVAMWYLVANIIFTALALTSILVTDFNDNYSIYSEHIGLFAVCMDTLLLSLVLSYQVGQMQKNESMGLLQLKRALKIATSDALTGALNRRAFDRDFQELDQHDQLFIIDIDGLKKLNDQFGHQRGDELLLRFCELARVHLSSYCDFYRIGGDEFAVIVKNSLNDPIKDAFKKTVAQLSAEGFDNIDASVGSAYTYEGADLAEVFKIADARMYENKQRNYGGKVNQYSQVT